ncbi:ABC transporter ATP-binding protein [Streptococcus constellatus subsp. pharyngis]|uniref:ABC transporter ATP-binding protein n=1 Tax=Streptococcus constellatus TaxID=76860 RepID=UPI0003908E03|nr:ABC transporter ATP-binding protein [Streptococcus constellatus]AGU73242.1 putative ABC transporter, ATP binding protein [Streptococcus constellatus subsp. pharyngis C232]AGU74996.1 putative ABC transporter, ATP binding protein [Streptococcus constellatus subsp. pharyngis C818]AGU80387.1 putative ABC transporter, ATP binding protein [Streptococcus constellatus subsp. pharyngis C1050]QQC22823.1 ABC transporter ATP-binding protein [Streptococcus constellatus]QRP80921.1 ABC transporter ATP-bin
MTILKMDSVSYQYNSLQENVLNQITASFEEGKFYAIIGKSGAGKSTLLSLLAGLDTPTKGKILFEDQDIAQKGYNHHRRKQISLVFQNYNLIDYLTPMENVRLVNSQANKDSLLQLGLNEKEIHRNVLRLSGGQQQRVAIARALASTAPIILADEPTGNLDEGTAMDIIEILIKSAKQKNKCVIVVTHSKELANKADVVLELSNKNLIEVTKNYK